MTTYLQTLMHLVKGSIGAGIFSMGIAFRNGGVVFATIFTVLIGLLVLHCITLLVHTIEELEKRNLNEKVFQKEKIENVEEQFQKTYADIVEEIFLGGPPLAKFLAKYMKIAVNAQICVMNIGFCCVFVAFVGNNMQKVLESFDVQFSLYVVILIFIIPMWLTSLITNLKYLAPISTFANVILFTALGITLYYTSRELPDFSSLRYIAGINTIPLFLSLALYSFDIMSLIAPLRNEMDNSKQLIGPFGILNVGFAIVIPIVVAVGFFSYFKYGNDIESIIFLNLPENDILVQALLLLVCAQVIFSYSVQLYVPVTIIWPMLVNKFGPFKMQLFCLLCFRTFLVLIRLGIAEGLPFVDLITSLIGAICSSCLTLLLPPVLDLLVFYNKSKSTTRKTYLLVKSVLIIAFALTIFITGVYTSLRDIINSLI